MKTIVFFSLSLFTAFCSFAQSGGVLWMGSRSGNAQANEVHAAIRTGYEAFIAGDAATAWNTYSQDVAEIDPGGNITYGLKAIREGYNPGDEEHLAADVAKVLDPAKAAQ